jgi:HSP20 family protein
MSDFYFGSDLLGDLERVQRQMSALFGNAPSSIRSSRTDAFPQLNIGRSASGETRTYAKERFHGAFRRVIELPQNVNPDKVEARYADGCLTIKVGKREASKPRAIAIQ